MKNKLYFQKQKINWNKNVKEYLARSNFKQTKTYNTKENFTKNFNYNFDKKLDLDIISSLLASKNLSKHLKDSLSVLLLSLIITKQIDNTKKEPEF